MYSSAPFLLTKAVGETNVIEKRLRGLTGDHVGGGRERGNSKRDELGGAEDAEKTPRKADKQQCLRIAESHLL